MKADKISLEVMKAKMKNLNDKILTRPWSGPGSNGPCLGTVHYLWAGGGRRFWGGGHLFLASRWEGGPLIFGKSLRGGATYFWREKILKSPRNPFFDTFSYAILGRGPLIFGKSLRGGATYFWQVADGGGHLFLAAAKNKISAPPSHK